ncbi:MAG: DUF3482 domain-containing protein [Nitrospirales bacterium]
MAVELTEPDMESQRPSITLSLISHTNMGKTTLARTLLRRDVGQVLDQAHVTLQNEQFILLETADGLRLNLWDTPGFGNSHKLLKRLHGRSNPIGWLVSQVWDRLADKPFWCSQQAIQNVRDEADVVLYLVNATEEPSMAGYLHPELEILAWLNKPVILLLNQTGLVDHERRRQLETRWNQHWGSQPVIYDVMSLDAFTRCWVQEGVLWDRITKVLPEDRQPLMQKLSEAWREKSLHTLHTSMHHIACLLIHTARDSEFLPAEMTGQSQKSLLNRAIHAMDQRLAHGISSLTTQLIALHGLSGEGAHSLQSRLEDVTVPGERKPWEEEGFWNGLVSGAMAGLASDFATGGLSHGLFSLGGAILGAWGGTAYAKSQDEGNPQRVSWVPEFLDRQARDAVLRYLAVTHSGRGKGEYIDPREFPLYWQQATEEILTRHKSDLHQAWILAKTTTNLKNSDEAETFLIPILSNMSQHILLKFYPEAASWFEKPSPKK